VGEQPDLMRHLFHFAPGPNRYGPAAFFELHVWAWKDNPRGTFAGLEPHGVLCGVGGMILLSRVGDVSRPSPTRILIGVKSRTLRPNQGARGSQPLDRKHERYRSS
jgi:hypothetical protein